MTEIRADTAQYTAEIESEDFSILGFSIHEELSELFRLTLTLWSADPEVDIKSLLRKDATIVVEWGEEETERKEYHGIVASVSQIDAGTMEDSGKEYGHYLCSIVPRLWTLSQQSNCRIFQEMSADEIIKKVLDERGMSGHYEARLFDSYPKREYCVQYRETDFAFISRLLEEEGIFYWFDHKEKGKLVLGDKPEAYGECWPRNEVHYRKSTGALASTKEVITDLNYEEEARSGKVTFADFDYRNPKKRHEPIRVDHSAESNDDLEIYDYHPERYVDEKRGKSLAEKTMKSLTALTRTISGSGSFRSLSSGCVFRLKSAYRNDLNDEWVAVSVSHSASQDASGLHHSVSFVAIPAIVDFRPAQRTPRPVAAAQTATVVGPAGEQVHMDDQGRAKVQFHWDREGQMKEDSSCWIRVAQPYAGINEEGKKHGFHWHPLIGDEVVVDFLEGDPDRPILVGSVYNAERMPPLAPKDLVCNMIQTRYQHKLRMDDKSKSITLGTPYPHTLVLDDPSKKASLTTKGGHSLSLWDAHADNSDVPTITISSGGGESLKMEDRQGEFGNNIRVSTKDGHSLHMAEGGSAKGITASTKGEHVFSLDDKEERILAYSKGKRSLTLDDRGKTVVLASENGNTLEISDQGKFIKLSDQSARNLLNIDTSKSVIQIEAGQSINIKATKDVTVDAMSIKVTGMIEITLQVGSNFVKIDPSGVTIFGTMVRVN